MMLMKIAGRVRGLFAGNYPENREDEQFHVNSRGDQIVAQGLPEQTEIVRLGESWQVSNASAFAPGTALPTTTAALTLWNGESAGGKSYVIDSVALTEIVVDATQSNMSTVVCMLGKPPVTAPTDAALVIRSLSGRTYGGRARTVVLSSTVVNDGWFPLGTSAPAAAAAAGSAWKQMDWPLRGMYIVPPGASFNLHALKVAATAGQCILTVRWHEVQLIVRS
jgi:hypothetical protein